MNCYFVGIGGIGMSALARFFHRRGDVVSGYDRTPSPLTHALEEEGISIHYADRPDLIPPVVDLAVYTPAVPSSLAELAELKARGVRLEKRSQVLGELTRGKKCIAVAGSHGKTSTSSLIAHLLHSSSVGCSAFLGGISKNLNSNFLVADSEYIVVEADEYDRSFLRLFPHIAIITATDPDHLDIYHTHQQMLDAYTLFADQTSPSGLLLMKQGVFTTLGGIPYTNTPSHPALSYSASSPLAAYFASDVHTSDGDILFSLHTPSGLIPSLTLSGTALFNVENAVAASAAALACGISEEELRRGLSSFAGVQRRFDYRIKTPRLVYIDDYAHHPREIEATLSSVRTLYPEKKVAVVFQPHLYSRTRDFAASFASALSSADALFLLPIYPAREAPLPGVSSEMILELMSHPHACVCSKEEMPALVAAAGADVVLTLGAGDIDRLVSPLEEQLRKTVL